jgi:hypothetical protein
MPSPNKNSITLKDWLILIVVLPIGVWILLKVIYFVLVFLFFILGFDPEFIQILFDNPLLLIIVLLMILFSVGGLPL